MTTEKFKAFDVAGKITSVSAGLPQNRRVKLKELEEKLISSDVLKDLTDFVGLYETSTFPYIGLVSDNIVKHKSVLQAFLDFAERSISKKKPVVAKKLKEQTKNSESLIFNSMSLDLIDDQLTELEKEVQKLRSKNSSKVQETEVLNAYLEHIKIQRKIVDRERKALISAMVARLSRVAQGNVSLLPQKPNPKKSRRSTSTKPDVMSESEFLGYLAYIEKNLGVLDSENNSVISDAVKLKLAVLPWYTENNTSNTPTVQNQQPQAGNNSPRTGGFGTYKEKAVLRFGVQDYVPTNVRRFEVFNKGHNFRARWFDNPLTQAIVDVGAARLEKVKLTDGDLASVLGSIERVEKSFDAIKERIEKGKQGFSGGFLGLRKFFYRKTLAFLELQESGQRSKVEIFNARQVALVKEIIAVCDEKKTDEVFKGVESLLAARKFLENMHTRISEHGEPDLLMLATKANEAVLKLDEDIKKREVAARIQMEREKARNMSDSEIFAPFEDEKVLPADYKLLDRMIKRGARYLKSPEGRNSPFFQRVSKLCQSVEGFIADMVFDDDVGYRIGNIHSRLLNWHYSRVLLQKTKHDGNAVLLLLSKYLKQYCDTCLRSAEELNSTQELSKEERMQKFINSCMAGLKGQQQDSTELSMGRLEKALLELSDGIDDNLCKKVKTMILHRENGEFEALAALAQECLEHENKAPIPEKDISDLQEKVSLLQTQLTFARGQVAQAKSDGTKTGEALSKTKEELDAEKQRVVFLERELEMAKLLFQEHLQKQESGSQVMQSRSNSY